MDSRLLRCYERELQFIREMGAEFAREFPKVAGRLSLDGVDCADPYVERLLEGFAFLSARVQVKLDARFPRFTQHLLEMVYPHYLAPTPSMAVVQFGPDHGQGTLASGFTVPRGTALRSLLGKGDQTPCEYRTAHDVTLWPLEVAAADYAAHARGLPASGAPWLQQAAATLSLTLRAGAGLTFDRLGLEEVPLFLRGTGDGPYRLYEQLTAHTLGVVVSWEGGSGQTAFVGPSAVRPAGFGDDEALLPHGPRSFQGYRLLQEYFAFPQRFLFVGLADLAPSLRHCRSSEVRLTVALSRAEPSLDRTIDASHLALFCTPAVNLFPRRADRIHVLDSQTEFHVVPDRTRPADFEVHAVTEVAGFGSGGEMRQVFLPLYAHGDARRHGDHRAYYTLQRAPRVLSAEQRRFGTRSAYVGTETYLSLVDGDEAPFPSDLRQLGVTTLCTNRDLPLHMPVGERHTDFTLETGAPVEAVRCVAGPTPPRPSHAEGETAWRLISHLSLNYLSLIDNDDAQGAAALREMLLLYACDGDTSARRQVEGLRSVDAKPVARRLPGPGPLAFGRGLEVRLTLEEAAFGGRAAFLCAAVIERFLARYVSLNSFTELVLTTEERGEVHRWRPRSGLRQVL